MRIGIVGSRKRNRPEDKKAVEDLVEWLQRYDIVISGGCRGVDTWASDKAVAMGLKTEIFIPNIKKGMSYSEMVEEYYRRNRDVVNASDVIYAFPFKEDEGGTGYTIKYAREKGKKVILQ